MAVKLVKPEIAQDEATIERFWNEVKVARKVSHRNVCPMHDLGKAAEGYFITMEYVEGEDPKMSYIRILPKFEPLRSDPRYQEMLKRMGLDKLSAI